MSNTAPTATVPKAEPKEKESPTAPPKAEHETKPKEKAAHETDDSDDSSDTEDEKDPERKEKKKAKKAEKAHNASTKSPAGGKPKKDAGSFDSHPVWLSKARAEALTLALKQESTLTRNTTQASLPALLVRCSLHHPPASPTSLFCIT